MGTKINSNYSDLITFTRASGGHALRPVSYGDELVENGDFSTDSDWTLEGTSISGGVLNFTNSGTYGRATQGDGSALSAGKLYAVSFEIKSVTTAGNIRLRLGDNTATAISIYASVGTHTEVFVCGSATSTLRIETTGSNTFTGTIDNISIKEVLFDQPDGTLTLFEHPNNVPRVEYDADRNRLGLLVEEQRVTEVTSSEDFSGWSNINAPLEANSIEAPNGTVTATKLVASTANGQHRRDYPRTYSAGTYTFSVFVKEAGYSFIELRLGGDGAVFDIRDGSTSSVSSGVTAEYKDITNGWKRVSITHSAAANDTSRINVRESAGVQSFAGDGASGIYIWGAQLEEGSFPTSYIKTTGSTATRSADVASIPVADFGYNQSSGTFVATASLSFNPSEDERYVIGTDSSSRRWIYKNNTLDELRLFDGSTSQTSTIEIQAGELFKVAVFSDSSTKGIATDGETPVTNATNSDLTSLTASLKIGSSNTGANQLNGHIKSIKYYPRRLTNAQIQTLTEPRSDATLSLTFDGLESSFTENSIHG